MASILQISENRWLEAVEAESGIEMARRYRLKLILMDIMLLGMDQRNFNTDMEDTVRVPSLKVILRQVDLLKNLVKIPILGLDSRFLH